MPSVLEGELSSETHTCLGRRRNTPLLNLFRALPATPYLDKVGRFSPPWWRAKHTAAWWTIIEAVHQCLAREAKLQIRRPIAISIDL